MKLIKKLVDWFEDLLWRQVIKDVFENAEYYEGESMIWTVNMNENH